MGPHKEHKTHLMLVSQIFYYSGVSLLCLAIGLVLFWQVEQDTTKFEYTESYVTTTDDDRDFHVTVNFCSNKVQQFIITRYYYNQEENIYYTLPDAKYRSAGGSCFNTRIHTNTSMLIQGEYEYRVFATYDLNPIRTQEQQVATVFVSVE